MTALEQSTRSAGGPSDAALVVAARAGEAWACEALYRRHVGTVHGLSCRLLGRDVDVDDIVQESFISAFASLESLDEANYFRSWLCGIAVRKTSKLLRKRKLLTRLGLRRRDEPIDLDRVLSRGAPPDVVSELRSIYGVLERLPSDVRVALLLRRVEGLTLEEIATFTGSSLATVKRRVAKGAELLRQAVGDVEGEGAEGGMGRGRGPDGRGGGGPPKPSPSVARTGTFDENGLNEDEEDER